MKRHAFVFVMLCACISVFAQATDLVIDIQTPGWLSSKINYGDQQTVRNLKVTGYINTTDLDFIGSLTQLSLNGVIDLSDANIIEGAWNGSFKKVSKSWERDYDYHLRKLILPKTLGSYLENDGVQYTEVDTLIFDTQVNKLAGYDSVHRNDRKDTQKTLQRCIGHLIIGENVDSVLNVGQSKTVHFPRSLRFLENYACNGRTDFSQWNIKEFPNLEYLGFCAFTYGSPSRTSVPNNQTLPDTISFPSIKKFCMSSFDYKEGMHIFFGDKLEWIIDDDGVGWSDKFHSTINNVSFHFKTMTPPLNGMYYCSTSCIIYVPKGAKQAYESNGNFKRFVILEEEQPLENLTLNMHDTFLDVGENLQLAVALIPSNADNSSVLWSSDNSDVAIVNELGLVTAIAPGVANIIASSVDGNLCDSCKVKVKAHTESITLSVSSIEFASIGENRQLVATILPDDAIDKSVIWQSSNESVCTVTNSGLVTATGVGTAVITAITVDGGHTATCIVKVIQHVTEIALNKNVVTLKVGESDLLKVMINPANADNRTVIWSSSNNQIATVDVSGNVIGLRGGETWIKVVSQDNAEAKDSCKVTVIQPVTGIALDQSVMELTEIGESSLLVATVMPEDATDKTVNWNSSNTSVCLVSNGLVVATGYGTSVVFATTVDSGFIAFCTVTVSNITSVDTPKGDAKKLSNPIYDMMGRKVEKIVKGRLYISEGKKFIAR